MRKDKMEYWQNVYRTKQSDEVSWTQPFPKNSLDFIHNLKLAKSASIIDIGGGDSKLVDFLVEEGYTDITVLDISEEALNRARRRLGDKAGLVKWIVADITQFEPVRKYDVWHDRATFHFLTTDEQIKKYVRIASRSVKGFISIGTFSPAGPKKCSGLDVKQYSESLLTRELENEFEKIRCYTEDHITPFNTRQNFLFCCFKKHLN